jgi:hypothetical protein
VTLLSASNLAIDLSNLGRHEEARVFLEDTLARRRRVLGEDHPDTLVSPPNLAVGLRNLGRHEEAGWLPTNTTSLPRAPLYHHGDVRHRDPARDKILSYEKDGRNDYGNSKKSGRKGVPWRKAWVNRTFRHGVRGVIDERDPERTDERVGHVRRKEWQKGSDLPLAAWVARPSAARVRATVPRSLKSSRLRAEAERRLVQKTGFPPRMCESPRQQDDEDVAAL